jgi:hypothetical protein
MVASNPVVDISVDPLDERRRRRRALLRIGIPLGGVALMIATILFIAFYADRANRAGALALGRRRAGGTHRCPRESSRRPAPIFRIG